MYYSFVPLLSHNAFISQSIGGRGIGKTFAGKEMFIRRFVKRGEQFVYMRRQQVEMRLVKDKLFTDLVNEGKSQNRHVKTIGNNFFVSNEEIDPEKKDDDYTYSLAGFAITMTDADYIKSASFDGVKWILFDEFIIDESKRNLRYLKSELNDFFGILETVIRNRNGVRVLMAANALSFLNPYMLYWNFDKMAKEDPESEYYKADDGKVVCQVVRTNDEFMKMKAQTDLYKVSKRASFFDMAYNNRFILDKETFIRAENNLSKYNYVTTLKYHGDYFGVWANPKRQVLYISEQWQPTFPQIFALTYDDHNTTTAFIGTDFSHGILRHLNDYYRDGKVECENMRCYQIIKNILVRQF